MRPHRAPAPLLPTHGSYGSGSYGNSSGSYGSGSKLRAQKRRGNVVMRLVMTTIVIAVCAYGGFAWLYMGRASRAQAEAAGRGLHETAEQDGGNTQATATTHRSPPKITTHRSNPHGNANEKERRAHAARMAQRTSPSPRVVKPAEHIHNTHAHGGKQQQKSGILHEASGDLHHPHATIGRGAVTHGAHQLAGGTQQHQDTPSFTMHHDGGGDVNHKGVEAGSGIGEVHQLEADLQHQADIQQQEQLSKTADAVAPVTTTTTTTTAAPVVTPTSHQLEVEQVVPSSTTTVHHEDVVAHPSPSIPTQQQQEEHHNGVVVGAVASPVEQQQQHQQQQEQQVVVQQQAPLARQTEQVHAPGVVVASPEQVHAPMPVPEEHVSTGADPLHGLYGLSAVDVDGHDQPLSKYKGNVTLVVNVASACGYTDENYKGLVSLYDKYHSHGLEILAFPCNQFGSQEPGTESEIKHFCSTRYHVQFPVFSKVEVNGANTHPVFKFLKSQAPVADGGGGGEGPGQDLEWNFFKFLVDRTGHPIKRWNQRWNQVAVEKEVYAALMTQHPGSATAAA